MKKIMNLGFITAALAVTIVSTVDARVRQVKTQTPTTTAPRTLLADTKAMINATPENKEKITIKVLNDIKANPETEELASLRAQRAEIVEDINLKNDELKAIAAELSWFDFSDPEYYSVKEEMNDLAQQLKVIDARINAIEKTQPKETIFSVKYAVAALIALGLADQLITGGTGRTALISGARNVGGKISTAAQTGWSYTPSAKTAFGYTAAAAGYGMNYFQIKDIITRLRIELSGEQDKPNPDQQKIDELEDRISELETAAKQQQK
jgi:hypothetical protein